MDWLKIVLPLVIGLLAGGASMYFFGFKKGYANRKQTAEAAISSAEEEAERIVDEAKKDAESKRKEIVLEGKEELHRLRSENDKEIRERRNEINKQEKLSGCGAAIISEDVVSDRVEKFPVKVLNQWTYHSRLYRLAIFFAEIIIASADFLIPADFSSNFDFTLSPRCAIIYFVYKKIGGLSSNLFPSRYIFNA